MLSSPHTFAGYQGSKYTENVRTSFKSGKFRSIEIQWSISSESSTATLEILLILHRNCSISFILTINQIFFQLGDMK